MKSQETKINLSKGSFKALYTLSTIRYIINRLTLETQIQGNL